MLAAPQNYIAQRFLKVSREYLADELRASGISPDDLRRQLPAPIAAAFDQEAIDWSQYQQLLDAIDRPGLLESIGLRIGYRMQTPDYGILGHAAHSRRTLGESLDLSIPFTGLLGLHMGVERSRDGRGMTRLAMVSYDGRMTRALQDLWTAMCVGGIAAKFADASLAAMEVNLTYPRPRYHDVYRVYLRGAHVNFGAAQCDWRFPEEWNMRTQRNFDREFELICVEKLAHLRAAGKDDDDLVAKVRSFLLLNLEDGVGMDQVAAHLGTSTVTLRRRLRAHGLIFKDMVEAIRRELASSMLAAGSVKVKEIGYRLGYSSPANFHTAFKSWYGCTAREYRSRHIADQGASVS